MSGMIYYITHDQHTKLMFILFPVRLEVYTSKLQYETRISISISLFHLKNVFSM